MKDKASNYFEIPTWVAWTIVITMVTSGISVAGSTIWGSSQMIEKVTQLTLEVTSIKNDLKDTVKQLDSKIEKNTDRIFSNRNLIRHSKDGSN